MSKCMDTSLNFTHVVARISLYKNLEYLTAVKNKKVDKHMQKMDNVR